MGKHWIDERQKERKHGGGKAMDWGDFEGWKEVRSKPEDANFQG